MGILRIELVKLKESALDWNLLGSHSRSHEPLARLGKVILNLPEGIPSIRALPLESRVPFFTVPSGSVTR